MVRSAPINSLSVSRCNVWIELNSSSSITPSFNAPDTTLSNTTNAGVTMSINFVTFLSFYWYFFVRAEIIPLAIAPVRDAALNPPCKVSWKSNLIEGGVDSILGAEAERVSKVRNWINPPPLATFGFSDTCGGRYADENLQIRGRNFRCLLSK